VTKEFLHRRGVIAGNATDEPIAIPYMGCHFNVSKLVATPVADRGRRCALPLCKFD
jgi:hypothetical protein